MSLLDLLAFCFANIWAQKLRTLLTLSAISVGALLVFLLPSLGLGVAKQVRHQFTNREGLNKIIVQPKYEEKKVDFTKADFTTPKLLRKVERQDIATLSSLQGVKGISIISFGLKPVQIHLDQLNKDLPVDSTSYGGFEEDGGYYIPQTNISIIQPGLEPADYGFKVTDGSFLESHVDQAATILLNKAIVDGFQVADPKSLIDSTVTMTFSELLPTNDSTGVAGRKNYQFKVAGVVQDSGDTPSNTPAVLITAEQAFAIIDWQFSKNPEAQKNATLESVTVVAEENDSVESLDTKIKDMGFATFTSVDAIEEFQKFLNVALGVLAAVGLIALFVGSLNIINTLMMAVSERTKEIGILRALGANRGTIRSIFLVESAVIAFLGAIVGVGLGWLISFPINGLIVAKAYEGVTDTTGLPTQFFNYSWELIGGVIIFVICVGLLSGLAPAIRASRLNVVDSLRYE